MSDVTTTLSLVLGGSGTFGLLAYILYNWATNHCSSHLSIVSGNLKQQIKEVMQQVKTPKQKEEVEQELNNALQRVKSRLQNTLDSIEKV